MFTLLHTPEAQGLWAETHTPNVLKRTRLVYEAAKLYQAEWGDEVMVCAYANSTAPCSSFPKRLQLEQKYREGGSR